MASPANPIFEELVPQGTPAAAAATEGTKPQAAQPDPAVAAAQAQVDQQKLALGEAMVAQGLNEQAVNTLLANNRQFQQLMWMFKNNPDQFQDTLNQLDPEAGLKLEDRVTTRFIDKHLPDSEREVEDDQRPAPASRGAASESVPMIRALQKQVGELTEYINRSERNRVAQQVTQTYNQNVDTAIDKVAKAANLNKRDVKSVRARMDVILGADVNAQQRFLQGQWTDIPRVLKQVMDDWTADTESTTEAHQTERDRVAAAAQRSVTTGAAAVGGDEKGAGGKPPVDDWEAGINEMAQALMSKK